MNLIDTAKLSLLALQRAGLLAADSLGDRKGSSLTFDPEQSCSPGNLNHWLNQHRVYPDNGQIEITDCQSLNIPSVSSNCNNVVLSIKQSNPLLPNSLFIKLPSLSLATRWFFSIIGSWQLESYFFKQVAQQVPLRTPITYATHSQGSRFFLIQENLHDDPTVQLFTNPDMMKGPSIDLAKRCLDAFARLHAHHYDLSGAEREAILPLDHHPFLSPTMRLVSQTLNQLALKPCLKKLPGRIPPAIINAYEQTLEHWEELLGYWFSGPLSLIHGDSHLGNFFATGEEMGMLDWQAVHWGNGIRDVQYFLIDSLPADVLATHEQEFISYYVERRGHYGTAIDRETTWQQYRSFTYHTLMTIVVSIGFGALNEEQNTLMEEILNRAVAAVERVDYPGWLNDFIQS